MNHPTRDVVVQAQARNAFCAVRPPGHHAGPTGIAEYEKQPHGSHGFCLLSNLAIGAAYAVNQYRNHGEIHTSCSPSSSSHRSSCSRHSFFGSVCPCLQTQRRAVVPNCLAVELGITGLPNL